MRRPIRTSHGRSRRRQRRSRWHSRRARLPTGCRTLRSQRFAIGPTLGDVAAIPARASTTGDNDALPALLVGGLSRSRSASEPRPRDAAASRRRWFPYNKGGAFRRGTATTSTLSIGRTTARTSDALIRAASRLGRTNSNMAVLSSRQASPGRRSVRGLSLAVLPDGLHLRRDRARRYSRRAIDAACCSGALNSQYASDCFGALNPTLDFTGRRRCDGFRSRTSIADAGRALASRADRARASATGTRQETSWDFARHRLVGREQACRVASCADAVDETGEQLQLELRELEEINEHVASTYGSRRRRSECAQTSRSTRTRRLRYGVARRGTMPRAAMPRGPSLRTSSPTPSAACSVATASTSRG